MTATPGKDLSIPISKVVPCRCVFGINIFRTILCFHRFRENSGSILAERAYQELYKAQKEAALGEILRVTGDRSKGYTREEDRPF